MLEGGKVFALNILHGGGGYKITDTLSVVGGGGSNAVLNPVFSNGKLVDIIIVNAGGAYQHGTSVLVAVEKLGGELYVSEEEFKRMAVYEFEATPDLHMTPWSSSRSRLPDTRLACRGPEPPSGSFERHRNLELLGRRQDLSLEIPEGLHTHRPSDSRPRAS